MKKQMIKSDESKLHLRYIHIYDFVRLVFFTVFSKICFSCLATHSERALLQKFIQPTLELVEKAWRGEATCTKRNRGI